MGLARRDGSAALLDGDVEGVLGTVPALVTVEPWARTAVAAVLGELADALWLEVKVVAQPCGLGPPWPWRGCGSGPGRGRRG